MVIQDREFDGTLYFLTSSKTGKFSDLVDHPKVNLAFAKPSTNRCGRLRVVQDCSKVFARHWTRMCLPPDPVRPQLTHSLTEVLWRICHAAL
jgi:general stress protein 26